ncbi:lmo0937 family membrane protein [Flavipsychrobacter stenotrophus]|uniref:Lmo0937 family membrane protein n=1 Tax=Flavipsychrobacter stenotrophus TaxID=2077091 RepID=A0A2S7SYN3_9BACT|nr:lmo0937 family membrane protein [Flavipsychrobacter stenotrophus]PQJ12039.1 lmo0937 family membrane protein [Flavipsychrobacter stenotrophus]
MALRGILYIVAIILFLGWVAGYFWFRTGVLINILLVLAVVSAIMGFVRKNEEE